MGTRLRMKRNECVRDWEKLGSGQSVNFVDRARADQDVLLQLMLVVHGHRPQVSVTLDETASEAAIESRYDHDRFFRGLSMDYNHSFPFYMR